MKNALGIARREFAAAFNSPVAYIVLGVFLLVGGWHYWFFPGVFLEGRASFRSFFGWMPVFMAVLAPALTMRSLAEERKTGTLEMLMTLPVRDWEIVIGKWLAGVGMLAVGLLFSVVFTFSIAPLVAPGQTFDWGPVVGGYVGSLLMASAFVAIGIYCSALSKNQVIAFIVALSAGAVLLLLAFVIFVLPPSLAEPIQYLSAYYHFESLARGVVDWRDVLYFASISAAALVLAGRALERVRRPGANLGQNATVTLVLASLVVVNVLAVPFPIRMDFTSNKAFTLSAATKETLKKLDAPVTVTAYFTQELPPPFSDNARYIRDLLEEYRAASGGNLSFSFVDPETQETDEDKEKKKDLKRDIFGRAVREKTSVETELEGLGIQPVEVRVLAEDQQQTKRAYMGVAVRLGEEKRALPVVQDTSSFEFDLTSIIRRIANQAPVLGVLQGHDEPSLETDLERLKTLLEQNFDVQPVTIGPEGTIPDTITALVVIGPRQALSQEHLKALDDFVMKGKSVAFFLDRAAVDLRSFEPTPVNHGLDELISSWGIELGGQLVGDVECASLNVSERRGFMVVQMPVKYPFIPVMKSLEGDSPITKGLSEVNMPFSVPLYPKKIEGVTVTTLARSSAKSWLEDPTAEGLNPRRDWGAADITPTGPYNLIASASGALPSKFQEGKKAEGEARILVAGSSTMLDAQVLGPPNATFFLNTVDWLVRDEGMMAMRNRTVGDAPLSPDISDNTRNVIKFGNTLGVPGLLVLAGLIRWRMRESKRLRLSASPKKTSAADSRTPA